MTRADHEVPGAEAGGSTRGPRGGVLNVLGHEFVAVEGSNPEPDRWMLFLHGILGRRANWRTFARRWVAARPNWGAVLVDLRDHGDSQDLPGPRTVAAAGADLVELAEALGDRTVAGVLGHSFGGKVAITTAQQLRAAGKPVDELWVIDAPPGPRNDPRDRSTEQIFARLTELPGPFATRSEFVEPLIAAGISKSIAQWLATNLIEGSDGWRFGLQLDHIRALLDDFKRIDLWPALEAEAAAGTKVTLVLGGRSEAVFGAELERARALEAAGQLGLVTIEGAGHWVHVDQPDALLRALAGLHGPSGP